MLILFALILVLLYTISWVGYSKYQFLERDSTDATVKKNANASWHRYKFLNQVVFFATLYFTIGLELALTLSLAYQLIFNSCINLIVESQPVFHLGNDPIDLTLKKAFGETFAYVFLVLIVLAAVVVCCVWPHLLDTLNYNVHK